MDYSAISPPIEADPEKYQPESDDTQNLTSEQIIARMIHAWRVIAPHAAILDCEIVQFFNRDHWSLVPFEWREFLMTLSANELAIFMDAHNGASSSDTNDKKTLHLPESLSKVLAEVGSLSLDRKRGKYHRLTAIRPGREEDVHEFRRTYEERTKSFPFYDSLLIFDKRKHPMTLLRYKCKDKKLAEIVVMGDLCFKASLVQKVDFIVDIGAGLGHLSRCLAYFYGIDVVSIEMDEKMTEEALRLDQKFIRILNSHAAKDAKYDHRVRARIRRITKKITHDITPLDFVTMVIEAYRTRNKDANFEQLKFGLVGLHPCGDLAPTMLNLYKNCPNCQFINIASCCYNKMSIVDDTPDTHEDQKCFIGFPLNTFRIRNVEDGPEEIHMFMGRNQLGLALHALENHQERFTKLADSFKADFYRALVEKFIEDVAPEYRDKRRKNVRTVGTKSVRCFEEYIRHSIPEILLDDTMKPKVQQALDRINEEEEFRKILAFSALRHMFAPLLETIVLLDRLLYLKEASSYCHVAQRFEARTSPRVHVITAFKK